MKELELLLRGTLAGLAISAPVGPVNVLCVYRTITKGRGAGIVSGLGAALADTLYGSIAGFSISLVISWMIREEFWIRIWGGALLIVIGAAYYFKRPKSMEETAQAKSAGSDIATTFLLALTNPTTTLSFLAVLAFLGMGEHRPIYMTLFVVGGIFVGGMLWWTVLALISGHFRDRFNDHALMWMNRIAAIAIGVFGLITAGLALKK